VGKKAQLQDIYVLYRPPEQANSKLWVKKDIYHNIFNSVTGSRRKKVKN